MPDSLHGLPEARYCLPCFLSNIFDVRSSQRHLTWSHSCLLFLLPIRIANANSDPLLWSTHQPLALQRAPVHPYGHSQHCNCLASISYLGLQLTWPWPDVDLKRQKPSFTIVPSNLLRWLWQVMANYMTSRVQSTKWKQVVVSDQLVLVPLAIPPQHTLSRPRIESSI